MNKRTDAKAAFTGLGGAVLTFLGIRALFSPTPGFGMGAPLYDLGVLAVDFALIGAGVTLLFYSLKRAKRLRQQ